MGRPHLTDVGGPEFAPMLPVCRFSLNVRSGLVRKGPENSNFACFQAYTDNGRLPADDFQVNSGPLETPSPWAFESD